MDVRIRNLRRQLGSTPPEHDTAIGLVHPYWARKPLNIVEAVIEGLSTEGDLVADPFMGSGTTLFAALKSGRSAVGGDISPLSVFLVRAILEMARNGNEIIPEVEQILGRHRAITSSWFMFNSEEVIERTRYDVVGDFAEGKSSLVPTEVVTKRFVDGAWRKRRAYDLKGGTAALPKPNDMIREYGSFPVDFENLALIANSRIAIPKGARLSHYFAPENRASINLLMSLIRESSLYRIYPEALMLILSSALPLLRLSDKKASSQWPYWRPRRNLTSRNPVMVLADRLAAIKMLAKWGGDNLACDIDPAIREGKRQGLTVHEVSAQRFEGQLEGVKVDLVLTDPPYGDQVPYLEYSSLWAGILGLPLGETLFREEVVRTDGEGRKNDTRDYKKRLRETFLANSQILKNGGYMVWYYQDQDLGCWQAVNEASNEARLNLVDVIPLPKQRRSLKTVTSPNSTLDGDLLCIFKKEASSAPIVSTDLAMSRLQKEMDQCLGSYFDKYALLISHALKYDLIKSLASQHKTVGKALAALSLPRPCSGC